MIYIMRMYVCMYVCIYMEVTIYWLKQVILKRLRIYLTTIKEREAMDLRVGKKVFRGRPRGKGTEIK